MVSLLASLGVLVDTAGARSPLHIDPLLQLGQKLTASGESSTNEFGSMVALSADGATALIEGAEATYVFTRSGGRFSEQATLPAGVGMALSGDGHTALVATSAGTEVFTGSGASWSEQATLPAGRGVALSEDGDTALIGNPAANEKSGQAWIYTRSGASWSEQAELVGHEDTSDSEFGYSVALSADAGTALVGGPAYSTHRESAPAGAAWVFAYSGGEWAQQGPAILGAEQEAPAVGRKGTFATSVALSAEGDTALIGGDNAFSEAPYFNALAGATWVYTRTGSSWPTTGVELSGEPIYSNIDAGRGEESVALSADGRTALIGGDRHAGLGAAWLFTEGGSGWSQGTELQGGSETAFQGLFGAGLALSADGRTAVIGDPLDSGQVGAAWLLTPTPTVTHVSPAAGAAGGGTLVNITGENLAGASEVDFGSTSATHFEVDSETSITAVAPAGAGTLDVTVTTPEGTTAPTPADDFGYYAEVSTFTTGLGGGVLGQMIGGAGGELWFLESGRQDTGRITPAGAISQLETGEVKQMTLGAGDYVYLLHTGRISPAGVFLKPFWWVPDEATLRCTSYVYDFAAVTHGAGGSVSYTGYEPDFERPELCHVEETPTEGFAGSGLPETHTSDRVPRVLAGGPGDVWFEWYGTEIVRLAATAAGDRQYPLGSAIAGMAVSAGDEAWFTEPERDAIGRLTPAGTLTQYTQGIAAAPGAIIAGSEGDMWFTEPAAHEIARITPEGAITQFSQGIDSAPQGIALGPEGEVWFTAESGEIGRLTFRPPPTVETLAASSIGQESATLNASVDPQRRRGVILPLRIQLRLRIQPVENVSVERAVRVAVGIRGQPCAGVSRPDRAHMEGRLSSGRGDRPSGCGGVHGHGGVGGSRGATS